MTDKVLCSIGSGDHARFLDANRPGRARYAARHGYDIVERTELLEPDRPASWSKLALVDELFDRYSIVFWVDADTAFVDDRTDPADHLSRSRWMALVRHTYADQTVPNLGVFAMRRSRGARRLLRRLSGMRQYEHHKWWENAAFLDLLGYDISSEPIQKVRTSRLERRLAWLGTEFNSIPVVAPADDPILIHFAGMTFDDRLAGITAAMATVDPTA